MNRSSQHLAVAGIGLAAGMLALVGCSSGPAPTSTTSATAGAGGGVSLVQAGKLTVCTHLPYAPFQSNDDSGKAVGFDVDMMNLVAKKIGVEQAIVDTPFEGIKSGQDMKVGKCDIAAAGMTITPERQKAILFSEPYFDATQALLVKTGSPITSLAALKGKKLGVQSSTTGMDYAEKHKADCGCSLVEFQDLASETEALKSGQVDAAMNDLPVWSQAMKTNPGAVKVSTQFNTGEQYGFGMKLGNTALKTVVDQVITQSRSDGTYKQLYQKWIGTVPAL
jgi:polar amino acid transport system substrate-binding protein